MRYAVESGNKPNGIQLVREIVSMLIVLLLFAVCIFWTTDTEVPIA